MCECSFNQLNLSRKPRFLSFFSMFQVTCRTVGIGSYLTRLGQRIVQVDNANIILTGFQALNKVRRYSINSNTRMLLAFNLFSNFKNASSINKVGTFSFNFDFLTYSFQDDRFIHQMLSLVDHKLCIEMVHLLFFLQCL